MTNNEGKYITWSYYKCVHNCVLHTYSTRVNICVRTSRTPKQNWNAAALGGGERHVQDSEAQGEEEVAQGESAGKRMDDFQDRSRGDPLRRLAAFVRHLSLATP